MVWKPWHPASTPMEQTLPDSSVLIPTMVPKYRPYESLSCFPMRLSDEGRVILSSLSYRARGSNIIRKSENRCRTNSTISNTLTTTKKGWKYDYITVKWRVNYPLLKDVGLYFQFLVRSFVSI